MKTDDDDDQSFHLTSAEDSPLHSPEVPIPFMTFDPVAKKARYYVILREVLDPIGNPTEVELSAEVYRDVLATVGVTSRNRLIDVLDQLDISDIKRAVTQIAYADE